MINYINKARHDINGGTMKEIKFLNSRGKWLAARLHIAPVNCGNMIVLVHGFAGDKDEGGLFTGAAGYFADKGFHVFRFDHEGCGDSEGTLRQVGMNRLSLDITCAIDLLKKGSLVKANNIFLVGFSLGASLIIMRIKDLQDVRGLAFWSPAFFPSRDMYPRYQTKAIRDELVKNGFHTKPNGKIIGKNLINDLGRTNLSRKLQMIIQPALVIHGGKDDRIDPESSLIGAKLINNSSTLILPEAGHSFREEGVAVKAYETTANFFNSLLK
jgi:uncharacterized protein